MAPLVRETLDELLETTSSTGELELVHELALPLSLKVVRRFLGLEEIALEQLLEWCDALALGLNNYTGDPKQQALADRADQEINEAIRLLAVNAKQIAEGAGAARSGAVSALAPAHARCGRAAGADRRQAHHDADHEGDDHPHLADHRHLRRP